MGRPHRLLTAAPEYGPSQLLHKAIERLTITIAALPSVDPAQLKSFRAQLRMHISCLSARPLRIAVCEGTHS